VFYLRLKVAHPVVRVQSAMTHCRHSLAAAG
jgi:hypothetical protein